MIDPNSTCRGGDAGASGRWWYAAPALPLRLALGGLMMFSGWMKLGIPFLNGVLPAPVRDSLDFFFAIKAFKMGLSTEQMQALSGVIPWAEFLAGSCLVLGWWSRSAALIIGLMLLGFIGGIVSLLARGIEADCPCFGSIKLFCGAKIGACHLVRNSIMLAAAAALVYTGGGWLSIDRWCARRRAG